MTEENTLESNLPELLNSCIRGDRQAQSKLYKQFASKLFVVCQRYSKNREEAEETLQEGFMKVFENLEQFKFAGSFEGWMRKIMVNCALQKYRSKNQLHALVSIENTEVGNLGNEDIISHLGTKELLKMVQQLPPAYRMVFNLYVYEGMKHREIAEQLNISEGTSKSNLSDARKLLQKAVTDSLNYKKPNVNYL
jgi:RNA polymerase sigma-70 factor (ECF subfamily)